MSTGGMSLPLPITALVTCQNCQGEGIVFWQGGPGHFDSAFGNYLPSEGEGFCPSCDGDGELVIQACPICCEETSACACSEDDIARYYASLEGDDPLARAA